MAAESPLPQYNALPPPPPPPPQTLPNPSGEGDGGNHHWDQVRVINGEGVGGGEDEPKYARVDHNRRSKRNSRTVAAPTASEASGNATPRPMLLLQERSE